MADDVFTDALDDLTSIGRTLRLSADADSRALAADVERLVARAHEGRDDDDLDDLDALGELTEAAPDVVAEVGADDGHDDLDDLIDGAPGAALPPPATDGDEDLDDEDFDGYDLEGEEPEPVTLVATFARVDEQPLAEADLGAVLATTEPTLVGQLGGDFAEVDVVADGSAWMVTLEATGDAAESLADYPRDRSVIVTVITVDGVGDVGVDIVIPDELPAAAAGRLGDTVAAVREQLAEIRQAAADDLGVDVDEVTADAPTRFQARFRRTDGAALAVDEVETILTLAGPSLRMLGEVTRDGEVTFDGGDAVVAFTTDGAGPIPLEALGAGVGDQMVALAGAFGRHRFDFGEVEGNLEVVAGN